MEKVRLAVIGLNFGKAHAGNIKGVRYRDNWQRWQI